MIVRVMNSRQHGFGIRIGSSLWCAFFRRKGVQAPFFEVRAAPLPPSHPR